MFIVIAVVTGGIAILLSKKKEGEDEREEPMPGPAKAVSYTHLDVYKRQFPGSVNK